MSDENQLAVQEPSIGLMLQKFIESGITTENVAAFEKLCDIRERMETREAERLFNASFADLQSKMPQVAATKPVPNKDGTTRYMFAPFEEIMEKIQPLLTEKGFSVSFDSRFADARMIVTCILRHTSGHSQRNEFAVRIGGGPPGATETQADGAAKTYAKRGALCDALNIVIEKDDDARMVGKFISKEEAEALQRRVKEIGANEKAFLAYAQAAHYEAISEERYPALLAMLDTKERKLKEGGTG